VEFLDDGVQAELEAQPADIRARFLRITRLIEAEGIHKPREPYVKHLEGPVWEMRMKGRDGIARAAYVTASGQRVVRRACVYEEHPEDATARTRDGP
jgi:phage-related protein